MAEPRKPIFHQMPRLSSFFRVKSLKKNKNNKKKYSSCKQRLFTTSQFTTLSKWWNFCFVFSLFLICLRGTMCAPPGGQNDVFIILDQVSRNTTCLPKESFYFFMFRNFRFQFNSFFKKFNFLQFIQFSSMRFFYYY